MIDTPSVPPASIASRVLRALRRLGPIGFGGLILYNMRLLASGRYGEHRYAYDRSFDRKYGVDTAGTVALEAIAAPGELKERAQRYEAADPDFFEFVLKGAGVTRRSDYLFVDLGSGKGRGLLLAALAGFPRVIGVEIDPGLHSTARRNIEIFSRHCPSTGFEAIQGDATTFAFPSVPTVLFLNNPFDEHLLQQVLTNIEHAHAETSLEFFLIYLHSNHEDMIRARDGWKELDRGVFRNRRQFYAIFRWRGGEGQS